MANRTLPETDPGLLAFSRHFSSSLSADPGLYGISGAEAAAYAALHAAYATALLAVEPGVRSRATVAVKNAARAALRAEARRLVLIVRGQPALSLAQQVGLGLAVRRPATAAPVPDDAPGLDVLAVRGATARLRLYDRSAVGRAGRPAGAIGASVFSFVGPTPPAGLAGWRFERNAGRAVLEVSFPADLPPGTTVWFTASWFNGRKQNGPMAAPVGTNLPGGAVSRAA